MTSDISGAFLQTDMEDFVLVVFEGIMVNILCKIDESYRKCAMIVSSGK